MADLSRLSELQNATSENRINFLRADLDICFTFAALAQTERESGERNAAEPVLEKAETGYATIARFLADVQAPEKRSELEQKLARLREILDIQHDLLRRSPLP